MCAQGQDSQQLCNSTIPGESSVALTQSAW